MNIPLVSFGVVFEKWYVVKFWYFIVGSVHTKVVRLMPIPYLTKICANQSVFLKACHIANSFSHMCNT